MRSVCRPGRVCVACEAARAHPVAVGRVRRRVGSSSSRERNHRARRNRGCDRRGWGQQWRVVRRRRIRSRLATWGEGCGTKVWRRDAEITSATAAAVRMRTIHGVAKARIAHAGRLGFDFCLVIPARGACAAAIKVTKRAGGTLTMAAVAHMSIVARLGVGLVGVESGAGPVTHRICHMVMSIAGWAVHVRGRPRAVVVILGAVFLTRVEASIPSTSIGLGLALLARVVRAPAVDILREECSKVVLEALRFLQVKLFLCLLY